MKKSALEKANEAIKRANLHFKLEDRGGWLSLRGVFPPRPGSGRDHPHQQRLPLKLPNNPQGLARAIDQAFEVRGLLNQEKFDWANYLDKERTEALSLEEVIANLHQQYLGEGGKEETWKHEYLSPFRKLANWQKPPDLEEMRAVLLAIAPETRVRKRTALALAKLADAAGLEHDLRRLVGTYNSNEPVNPRDIPSDEAIAYWWGQIPNPEWRCAYALQAIYGLRNYEIFKLDFEDFPVVFVNRGKTQAERYTYPLYPEWCEAWLAEIKLPACQGSNTALGNRVTHQFARYKIPFAPYDLRHAWARRSIDFGWDQTLAAAQMGHDIGVHTRCYQQWIKRDTYQRAYELLVNRPDRPRAPLSLPATENPRQDDVNHTNPQGHLQGVGGSMEAIPTGKGF